MISTPPSEQAKLYEKIESMTEIQREVFHHFGQGMGCRSIARKMFRSHKTIESHIESIGRILNIHGEDRGLRIAVLSCEHRLASGGA